MGLFDDDVAEAARDLYRGLVANGHADPELLPTILGELAPTADEEDVPVIVLAVAAAAWSYGRLEAEQRERALEVIDSGRDLRRWEGSGQEGKRAAVLVRLREKLLSPQPRRRTPRRRRHSEVPAHRLPSPDGLSTATAFQIAGPGQPFGPRAQVLVEQEVRGRRGGGGVFVAACTYDSIRLRWLDDTTLEISYPEHAPVEAASETSFYCGRVIALRYTPFRANDT